jgi:DNA-binding MarR family transcriptional regulator
LYRNKDSTIFQKDIENTFEIRGGTVTGLIDSLVSLNYIKRVESEIDKRKRKILLTAEGEEQAGKCIDIINNIESMLANELTADEKEVFNTIMDKINIILDEEESK